MGSDDQRPPSNHDPVEREGVTPGDTESVERYRRAHEVIERMRADQRPDRSGATDDDPLLDMTAALLRSAAPAAAEVDPGFAARLFARLETAQEPPPPTTQAPAPASSPANPTSRIRASRSNVSRRGLVIGGLSAAAAAVIGGAAGAAIEAGRQPSPQGLSSTQTPKQALIPDGVGSWVPVAHIASVPLGAVIRFQTDAVIGYLRHSSAGFVALSGVCTHMACLLQWNGVDRTFDCPCHGSRFLENGQQAPGEAYPYPPLPNIKTKVEADQVWVYVISTTGSSPSDSNPPPTSSPSGRYGA